MNNDYNNMNNNYNNNNYNNNFNNNNYNNNNMNNNGNKSFEEKAKEILNDVVDESAAYTNDEKDIGKGMSIISYIGILCLIPYLSEKNNKYIIYHAKQGLNLFIIEAIVSAALWIMGGILGWRLSFITNILEFVSGICFFALSILGIVNVCNGRARELPIVNKFKIIK